MDISLRKGSAECLQKKGIYAGLKGDGKVGTGYKNLYGGRNLKAQIYT